MTVCLLRCRGSKVGLSRNRVRPHHYQRGMGQQTERDEAVPRLPGAHLIAHLIVIQPDFPLGLREAFFNRPAPVRDPHQVGHRGCLRAVGEIVGKIVGKISRLVGVAADEEPAPLPGSTRR